VGGVSTLMCRCAALTARLVGGLGTVHSGCGCNAEAIVRTTSPTAQAQQYGRDRNEVVMRSTLPCLCSQACVCVLRGEG
jgi:hypothetical protein